MIEYPIPTEPPTYISTQNELAVPKRRIYALLDSASALIGLLLTFWFSGILLWSGLELSLWAVFAFIGFWLVLTYLALPRLHQIFTTLYVPDYFMSRTKTGDGLLGDPINLALNGSEEDLHAAMRRAGWVMADEITLRSSLGIVKSSVTGTSYPEAPVSDLFLFDRRHDFAYQQEVDGNAAQRHHVRFWHAPDGWKLPGGHRVDWLAGGTYDNAVGLSTMTLQITHKIDANVDTERDYIINTVRYADPEVGVSVIEDFTTAFHDENGGGDAVYSDGNMPILDTTGAAQRLREAGKGDLLPQESRRQDPLDKPLPPAVFIWVGIMLAFQLLASGIGSIFAYLYPNEISAADPYAPLTLFVLLGVTIIEIILLVLTAKKYAWARLAFLLLVLIMGIAQVVDLTLHAGTADVSSYIETALSVVLILSFSSPAVRQWVSTVRRRGWVAAATNRQA